MRDALGGRRPHRHLREQRRHDRRRRRAGRRRAARPPPTSSGHDGLERNLTTCFPVTRAVVGLDAPSTATAASSTWPAPPARCRRSSATSPTTRPRPACSASPAPRRSKYAGDGITVNAVAPGLDRHRLADRRPSAPPARASPMERSGTPAEVAAAVRFLADPAGVVRHRPAARGRRRQLAARGPLVDAVTDERRSVLVTGAAGGIGGAAARVPRRRLARRRRRRAAGPARRRRRPASRPSSPTSATSPSAAPRSRTPCDWAGRLDAVVNAAGVWTEGPRRGHRPRPTSTVCST